MAWRPSVRSDAFDVALAVVLGALAALSLYVGGDPFLTAPELADYSRPWGIVCLAVMHLAPWRSGAATRSSPPWW